MPDFTKLNFFLFDSFEEGSFNVCGRSNVVSLAEFALQVDKLLTLGLELLRILSLTFDETHAFLMSMHQVLLLVKAGLDDVVLKVNYLL